MPPFHGLKARLSKRTGEWQACPTISGHWSYSRKRIVETQKNWLDALTFQNSALEGRTSSINAVGLVQLLQFFVKMFDGME